jgi:hypothetical protein
MIKNHARKNNQLQVKNKGEGGRRKGAFCCECW